MVHKYKKILFTLLIHLGCATPPVPQHALVDQILSARKGFDGKLTNSHCVDAACKDLQISAYDLSDSAFRETVNKLDFICNIAGHRWKVCLDKPGFCRLHHECAWWDLGQLFCKEKWDFIPVEPYQYLIDSRTRCFSKKKYPFDLE